MAVSYIESSDMSKNLSALMSIVKYIYQTMVYAEVNTKSDYCQKCGYDGEIEIIDKNGKLFWRCPNCGKKKKDSMKDPTVMCPSRA